MAAEDSDWKPNGRPQSISTIARSFSAALNDAFKIDGDADLGNLSQAVEDKKQAVSTQNQELEALEARLRETEERLRQKQQSVKAPTAAGHGPSSDLLRQAPSRSWAADEGADRLDPHAHQPSTTSSDPASAVPGHFAMTPASEKTDAYLESGLHSAQPDPIPSAGLDGRGEH